MLEETAGILDGAEAVRVMRPILHGFEVHYAQSSLQRLPSRPAAPLVLTSSSGVNVTHVNPDPPSIYDQDVVY